MDKGRYPSRTCIKSIPDFQYCPTQSQKRVKFAYYTVCDIFFWSSSYSFNVSGSCVKFKSFSANLLLKTIYSLHKHKVLEELAVSGEGMDW